MQPTVLHTLLAAVALLGAAESLVGQSIPGAVLAKREPHHHLVYEDSVMRVLRVRVGPHDTTLLHEHDPDYFWIALGPSEVVNAKRGAADATIKSADLSIHYTPGQFAHVARNPGSIPFDNITVELLRSQGAVRNLCEPAVANQPLDCPRQGASARDHLLRGADEHPAFATSRLRISLATIAPNALVTPVSNSTSHGRIWLIALDTSDVASLSIGDGGKQGWVGGVYRAAAREWSLRNRGARAIRVLAVEGRD